MGAGGGVGKGGGQVTKGGKKVAQSTSAAAMGHEDGRGDTGCAGGDEEDDEIMAAAMAMLSSTSTAAGSPVTPPPPPLTPSPPSAAEPGSDVSTIRGQYDRELLAILEEEQAAESARESALAAAKAWAKVAQARAGHVAGKRRKNTGGSGSSDSDPATATMRSQVDSVGDVGGGDLQKRRDEEAAAAAREEARLEQQLAKERKEAGERIMRVSEAYEKALEKLSSGESSLAEAGEPAGRPRGAFRQQEVAPIDR